MRRIFLLLGIVLAILVAAGTFIFIQQAQPAYVDVPVASEDIPAGTVLDAKMFRVTRLANVDRQTISRWVTVVGFQEAQGKVTTSDIPAGFPIAKSQIDPNAESGAAARLSLAITGTNDYYIVLPVSSDDVGMYIQPNDRIDLIISLGEQRTFLDAEVQENNSNNGTDTQTEKKKVVEIEKPAVLPVSKLMVQNLQILRIDREGSDDNGNGNAQARPPRYLYIKVDRDQLEVLSFILNNGKRQYAIRAASGSQDVTPTGGVTWDDFVRWFYTQRGANPEALQPFKAIGPYEQAQPK